MAKKSLKEEFSYSNTVKKAPVVEISDYEIFKDKKLLDNLRSTIIQNIIDNKVPDEKDLN